jgi:hypothetical protein
MANAVYCIASNQSQAEQIVVGLQNLGVSTSEISVLFPDKSGTRDFAHANATKAPEGAAAGPILAALSGAGVGGAVGGLAGALIGMGIPEVEAKHYEGKVREGNILISAHVEDNDLRDDAKKVMEESGATDVKTWSTTKPPKADNRSNEGNQSRTRA